MKPGIFRAAVVGLGGVSSMHIKSLEAIGIAITAVCDNKPEQAKAAGDSLKCAFYTCYEEMLASGGFEVVHICLPHYLHAPVAIAALNKNYHVVCEKPMATTVADAEDMISAAETNAARLEIIFQNRFNQGSKLIKTALDSGELGQVTGGSLRVTWHRNQNYYTQSDWRGRWATEGGGALINQSIHTFDLVNYFLGAPKSVNASIANRAHPYIEVEDVAEGIIEYNNAAISFFVNTYHPYDAPVSLELVCEKGRAVIHGEDTTMFYKDGREVTASKDEDTPLLKGKDYWGNSHVSQIKNFYDSLTGKPVEVVCGTEGIRTQRLINGIYDSAKFGQTIYLQ